MMNNFENTNLPFLADDCIAIFGDEKGKQIFNKAVEIYSELIANADYRGSDVIKYHLTVKLFPTMSFYKSLLSFGFDTENALEKVLQETQKAALKDKLHNEEFSKMPFAYAIYRMGAKKHVQKNFPNEGWKKEWIKGDRKEIFFTMHSCLYYDMCVANGCPELCRVFCENDITAFSGLLPKIKFERNGTIGEGADCCDFHFINQKKRKS